MLPAGNTIYVYDAFGRLSAEYSTATVPAPCTTCYLSKDHLGSTRLVTNQNGAVVGRHDFAPFGQEVPSGYAGRNSQFAAGDTVNQLFTGQERDSETGLDYFGARYLASGLGRFLSLDPANAGAALTHPQSWNAYAYVGNNPLKATAPSGRFEIGDDEDETDPTQDGGGGGGPVSVACPECTITVDGGAPDTVDPSDSLSNFPYFGGHTFTATGTCWGRSGGPTPTPTPTPAPAPPPPNQPAPPQSPGNKPTQVPPTTWTRSKQQSCVNDFYNSAAGQAVQFGSPLAQLPGWNPEWGSNLKEWGTAIFGKLVGLLGSGATAGVAPRTKSLRFEGR